MSGEEDVTGLAAALEGDVATPADYRGDGAPDAAATEAAQAGMTAADLLAFVTAATADGLVRHNIEGYDALVEGGLDDIIRNQFRMTRAWKNERPPTTEEDRRIVSWEVMLSFHDLHVGAPTCTTYATGLAEPMYPARSRITGQPYSGQVTVAASVVVRAFARDGAVAEKSAEIPPFPVGSFPVMVRGANCHTRRCTGAALAQLGEDPADPGGYFVMKMGEWVVDLLENIRYNTIHVHARMGGTTELVRAEFLSQPGGAFDNSSQLRLRLMQSGMLTFELNSTHFEKVRLPFFLLYRLFGMTSDRDIAATVVYRPESPATPTDAAMCEVLAAAFHLADSAYEWALNELAPATLAARTAEQLITYLQGSAFASDDNAAAYVNGLLLVTLDKVVLPHVGVTPADRARKLRFLGLMIRRALLVHLGAREPTDRDSYRNKRVHGAGVSLAKAFKTQVANSVVGPLIKALRRELRNNPFSALTPGAIVGLCRNALVASDLNRAMEQAITAGGNKASVVKRRVVPSRVSSQSLERKNPLNAICALRAIVTQHAGASPKGTDRADQMRRVHPTYAGYICPLHSLDTGENVGMKKQLAATTGVTPAGDAPALKRRLLADPLVRPLAALSDADLAAPGRARVFVNGDWLGTTDVPAALAAKYRRARRRGAVDPLASICWDPAGNEVEFWLDVGRLYRPLLIVDGNADLRDAALRAAHRGAPRGTGPVPEFFQGCRITAEDTRGLASGRVSIADLVRWGVAEYITPEEQESCLIAPSFAVLRDAAHDPARRYTHVEVEQAMFGVAALISPYLDHTQPVRVTYETNQARQTAGWYALNFFARVDKNLFFQYYCEQPLVYTIAHSWCRSNGFNVSIAYMCYGGDNQEDSVIVNRAAADRGLFAGAFFYFEKAELEKGEVFATPDPVTTKGLKPNSRYGKLVDGFVQPGTIVEAGDVLIGRVSRLPRGRDDRFTHSDRSVVYRKREPAVVESVMRPRGVNDEVFGLVKLRYERPLVVGDKQCLTPDHEVLTATRGWVPVAAVTVGDRVACLAGGVLEYAQPTAVHTFDVDEDVYEIDAQMVSQRVTLNHRMWVRERGRADFDFCEARDLIGRRVQYKRNALNMMPDRATYTCRAPGMPDLVIGMEAWLGILGAFISDGWTDKRCDHYVAIAMTKPRKIEFIRAALADVPVKHWHVCGKYFIDSHQLAEELRPLSVGAVNKRLPEMVWDLSQAQARVLLAALVRGDGHVSRSCTMYYTSSAGLADDVQRLALHAGYSSNILMHCPAGTVATFADGRTATASVDSLKVSIVMAKNEPMANHGHCHWQNAQVERVERYTGPVHCLTVPSGVFYIRRGGIPGWTGNSSRSGNKSITARLVSQADMPFDESGMTPDLIINPHSFPKRMVMGQLIETVVGVLCARRGAAADGTAFLPLDYPALERDLVAQGLRPNGRTRLYHGATGAHLDVAITLGFILQQRLLKFVNDDEQCVGGAAPTDATTGQPLGGKHVQGGLRIGNMELDVLSAHGAAFTFEEKLRADSDARTMYVCRGCGGAAVVNEAARLFDCRACGELADVVAVPSGKSAMLFREELAGGNIDMRLGPRPREFERMCPRDLPAASE